MPSFVHTADVHLDTPFSANFNAKQMQLRRREVMKTFRNIVLAAKDEDFLFICGDLFDGGFVSSETLAFVKRCFAEIPDTQVLIVAGNHDPLEKTSPYQSGDWGENVRIFAAEGEYFDFPEKKVRIHGRSFSASHIEDSLLWDLDLAPDFCNIILLHGEIVADGGKSFYNPIEKGRLQNSGVDYLALGHIHQASGCQRLGKTYYAYCGVPEGRGFDEEGEKGYYRGVAEKGSVQLTWVPASQRRFWHLDVDVSGMEDSLAMQDAIEKAIAENGGYEDAYKISLVGKAPRGLFRTEILREELANTAFYLDILDKTRPAIEPEKIALENTLRGDFTRTMLEKISAMPEEEKEIGVLALELGLAAMEGGQGV